MAASAPSVRRPLLLPAFSLARRELVRFLRQRNRIIGALLTPIVFWVLIGAGMGRSFRAPDGSASATGASSYLHYFYPGTVLMILLFTAIFSTISIIEDRREGFLQSVLVAPISPMVIVLGKVLGGTALAFGQGVIFLALAPLVGFHFTIGSFALALLIMFIVSFGLTALGFCIAWRMSSTQGFHAIMNLFLMPMWFLSGALFPASGAMKGLGLVIRANPLSYGLSALRQTMDWSGPVIASFGVSLAVSAAFALALFLLASAIATGRTSADLQ
jgi:ABC-2 type transport system permease protein